MIKLIYYLLFVIVILIMLLSTVLSVWIYVTTRDTTLHDKADRYRPSEANSHLSSGQVALVKIVIALRTALPYVGGFVLANELFSLINKR